MAILLCAKPTARAPLAFLRPTGAHGYPQLIPAESVMLAFENGL